MAERDRRSATAGVTISEMLGEGSSPLNLALVAGGKGLDRRVTAPRIQKPGFALTGSTEFTHPERVQVLGFSEMSYLMGLAPDEREARLRTFFALDLCCVIVTSGLEPTAELVALAEEAATPLLHTKLVSSVCIDRVSRFLESKLAPRQVIHGDFLEVFGIGVLLLGDSGIGKSECALDLVSRGQRLISDDVVEIVQEGPETLVGSGPELTRYHMEIRGLGLINIKDLFGISAVRHSKPVELIVMLEQWDAEKEVDRLGITEQTMRILGVEVPMVGMPVAPGRNLANLIEVAARNHILKTRGQHAARDLVERLDRLLASKHAGPEGDIKGERAGGGLLSNRSGDDKIAPTEACRHMDKKRNQGREDR